MSSKHILSKYSNCGTYSKMDECLGVLGIDVRFAWIGAVCGLQVSRSRNKSLFSSCLSSVLCGLCCVKEEKDGIVQEMAAVEREWQNGSIDIDDDECENERLNNITDVVMADLRELSSYARYTKIKQRSTRVHELDLDTEGHGRDPVLFPGPDNDFGSTRHTIFVVGPHWYCVFVALGTIVGGAFLTNNILSNMDYSSNLTLTLRGFVNICCTSAVIFLFLTATVSSRPY